MALLFRLYHVCSSGVHRFVERDDTGEQFMPEITEELVFVVTDDGSEVLEVRAGAPEALPGTLWSTVNSPSNALRQQTSLKRVWALRSSPKRSRTPKAKMQSTSFSSIRAASILVRPHPGCFLHFRGIFMVLASFPHILASTLRASNTPWSVLDLERTVPERPQWIGAARSSVAPTCLASESQRLNSAETSVHFSY